MPYPNYSIELTWDDREDRFIATCPSFPDLSAFGETREEALKNAEIVLAMFIDAYEEEGIQLPEARVVRTYTGQLRVRLPRYLHATLAGLAEREGVSLNTLIIGFLSERVGAENISKCYEKIVSITAHPGEQAK